MRRAAKRARYAGESLAGTFGRPATEFAARMKAVQEVLGAHQDSVVIRGVLVELADEAERAGESSFSYGRLHALEQQRAAETEGDFARVWRRACRSDHRGWLT